VGKRGEIFCELKKGGAQNIGKGEKRVKTLTTVLRFFYISARYKEENASKGIMPH